MKKFTLLMVLLVFIILGQVYASADETSGFEIIGLDEIQSVFEAGAKPSSSFFVEGLELYDNSGGLVPDKLLVDMVEVDFNRVGTYQIYYYGLTIGDESRYDIAIKEINIVDTTKPKLKGIQPITVKVGTKKADIDYLDGVSATDNDLSSKIVIDVIDANVNLSEVGSYPLIYYVVDNSNNVTIESTRVFVENNEPIDKNLPMITLDKDIFYFDLNHEFPNYLEYVMAVDGEIDLTSEVRFNDSGVDYNTVGDNYKVLFIVMDADGNLATIEAKVVIEDDITPPDFINLGDTYDLTINTNSFLKNVKAIDKVWGDVTNRIVVTPGSDFDFHKEGYYDVTYTVSDLSGNVTPPKIVKVHVFDNLSPVITAPELINIKANSKLDLLGKISVKDNIDTDLNFVLHENNLDLTTVGSYLINISAIDSAGNKATKQIIIYVYDTKHDKFYENPIILGSLVGMGVSLVLSVLGVKFNKKNY